MHFIKLNLLFFFLLGTSHLSAQHIQELLGEWESYDSDGHGKYFVFEVDGKIYACLIYWKDDQEEFSLEKELEKEGITKTRWINSSNENILTEMKELLVLKDFAKNESHWEGSLIYDEEGSTIHSKLRLTDKDQLEISYSYWGFSEKSIWKRIKS